MASAPEYEGSEDEFDDLSTSQNQERFLNGTGDHFLHGGKYGKKSRKHRKSGRKSGRKSARKSGRKSRRYSKKSRRSGR